MRIRSVNGKNICPKITAVLVAALLSATGLCACGTAGEAAGAVEAGPSAPGIAETAASAASSEDGLFCITSIDVGKGDCLLVQTGSDNVMIDTGYNDTSDTVTAYLTDHGITHLDALIISHYDKDHVGGADEVIESVDVSMLYLPDYRGTRDGYKDMMRAAVREDVPYEYVSEESSFSLGDAEYFLYPSDLRFDGEDDNDMSLAASVRYHGYSALFTGDMEEDEMTGFVGKHRDDFEKCDILKMPHHGREEDMTEELLDMVSPEIVIVTDGKEREMEDEVRDLLDEKGLTYYSSLEDGTVVLTGGKDPKYTVTTVHTEMDLH